jgi:hypothetical protein
LEANQLQMQYVLLILIVITGLSCNGRMPQTASSAPADTLSLVFAGDIMGHDLQIRSAWNDSLKKYSYDEVFQYIRPLTGRADFAIANFEVTLGGLPYKGYPQFSSPDELAQACKNAGFDVLMTANNHACDKGKKGILRTLDILDSLQIKHTGTFRDSADRRINNLLVVRKDSIRIGFLNYTYGTNGITIPRPAMVNLIDTLQIGLDIVNAQTSNLDKLIVFVHWGAEYISSPDKDQIRIADFLFRKGVDIVIGSHPHVIQKMEFLKDSITGKERIIAWSLGNFVSDQRTVKRDGGAMIEMKIVKDQAKISIIDVGYHLTWVYKPVKNDNVKFQIIPCAAYDTIPGLAQDTVALSKCKYFLTSSGELLNAQNLRVNQIFNP